jgi:hypothetical protein
MGCTLSRAPSSPLRSCGWCNSSWCDARAAVEASYGSTRRSPSETYVPARTAMRVSRSRTAPSWGRVKRRHDLRCSGRLRGATRTSSAGSDSRVLPLGTSRHCRRDGMAYRDRLASLPYWLASTTLTSLAARPRPRRARSRPPVHPKAGQRHRTIRAAMHKC